MAIRPIRFVKRVVTPFVNFPAWMGLAQIKDVTKRLVFTLKPMFVPPAATDEQAESFEATMVRMNLTEGDLIIRQKEFMRLFLVYIFIAAGAFIYAFYLAWQHSIHGTIASFILMFVALTQAFRYHFWLFQLRSRRLGCTFREWLDSGFLGEKK